MWRSPCKPKRWHHPRHCRLFLEELEKRELLNGSPLPEHPQQPFSYNSGAAQVVAPAANNLLPGYALPGGVLPQQASDLPAQGWQAAGQLPALLGPVQKSPT
jgi:hypothetical protein